VLSRVDMGAVFAIIFLPLPGIELRSFTYSRVLVTHTN